MAEDGKEFEANCAAIMALHQIKTDEAIEALKRIVTCPLWDEMGGDDCQWEAASALSERVGQPFMVSDNPVQAAINWVTKN